MLPVGFKRLTAQWSILKPTQSKYKKITNTTLRSQKSRIICNNLYNSNNNNNNNNNNNKVRVKFTREQAMKAHRGNKGQFSHEKDLVTF